ncbi:MAG: hypothetical protein HDQ88_01155 [Clostridia bacterium]|nr:hypothetical protein [Clostridia bacterium]
MEKFALLDFLKAFETLSGGSNAKKEETAPVRQENEAPAPPPPTMPLADFNAMATVLARHEEIANRIKNNRR